LRTGRGRVSGSVLGLALALATVVTTGTTLPLCAALVESAAVAGAADAAALAAADVASGRMPGQPCEAAARLAEANDAVLTDCVVDGAIVTVVVERWVGVVPVRAIATAGPPATVR
jgi:secretion/DNA translocation related TadE-like protein